MAVLQLDSNLRAGNEDGHNGFVGFDVSNFDTSKDSKSAIFKHLGDLLKNV